MYAIIQQNALYPLYICITSCLFCDLQAFTALKELDLTWEAVQRELTVLTQATGLSLSAGSVMAAITALQEMAQLSLAHVRKGITAHMETPLHNLSRRLEVNIFARHILNVLHSQEMQYSVIW